MAAISLIITLLLAIISVILLSGRGAYFIAGYNTSRAEDKARYDEKKLCRFMGAGMLLITILLFIMTVFKGVLPSWFSTFFILATLADVIAMTYIANTKCYKNAEQMNENGKEHGKKTVNSKTSIGISVVILCITGVILFTGNINMDYGKETFTIKATYWADKEIAYHNIENLEYSENTVSGNRVGGFGSPRLQMGNFKNNELGTYTRYTYTKCNACVVLTVKDNKIVINGKNKEKTQAIYEELSQRYEP